MPSQYFPPMGQAQPGFGGMGGMPMVCNNFAKEQHVVVNMILLVFPKFYSVSRAIPDVLYP